MVIHHPGAIRKPGECRLADETLGTSLGALGTVNGTTKFVSSTAVGLLWTVVSPVFSFGLAAGLMALGTVLLARLPRERGDGT